MNDVGLNGRCGSTFSMLRRFLLRSLLRRLYSHFNLFSFLLTAKYLSPLFLLRRGQNGVVSEERGVTTYLRLLLDLTSILLFLQRLTLNHNPDCRIVHTRTVVC